MLEVDESFQDEMGHGTAVFSIIRKFSPDSEILNIKLFDENGEVSEEGLFESLKYIRDNVNCKIINLSCGIKYCNHEKELEEICVELQKKGIIIISAFDNDGCCSFPEFQWPLYKSHGQNRNLPHGSAVPKGLCPQNC